MCIFLICEGGGIDYFDRISLDLVFTAIVTEIAVEIPINDDVITENNERLEVSLLTNDDVTLDPDNGFVTIIDDDRECKVCSYYVPIHITYIAVAYITFIYRLPTLTELPNQLSTSTIFIYLDS